MMDYEVAELYNKNFETRDQLVEEVKKIYRSKGYALTIKDSRKDRYVTIGCDRGGVYRDRRTNPPVKESSTRLINCGFKIYGKMHPQGTWTITLLNGSHNHEASLDSSGKPIMSGHPSACRLTQEETVDVDKMSTAGIRPWQILSSLRQKNPSLEAKSRTIYNKKAKLRLAKLDGRSMIKALFDELVEGGFSHNYKNNDMGHLTDVIFSHPKSMILSKMYKDVYVIDCTYKTNRYKMPLLDIVGMSSFNKSFYSCFASIEKEKEEHYIWALKMFAKTMGPSFQPAVIVTDRELALINAINVVFPGTTHLLCVWHIEKNVTSNCKKHFKKKEDWDEFMCAWNNIVYAKSDEEFKEAWASFNSLYGDKQEVIGYINTTWIPYKEKFVSAWTEKYTHFGNRATSRVEGAHSKLKRYLQVSSGDFRQVRDKIALAVDIEFQEIKSLLESEKIRVPHKFRVPFIQNLVGHVSTFAMNEIFDQFNKAKYGTMSTICSGHFRSSMGLPYAHDMVRNGREKVVIPLQSIHMQWRIDTRSLEFFDSGTCEEEEETNHLADKLVSKYHEMPSCKKGEIKAKLSHMLDIVQPTLFEPHIQSHKGRPPITRKRKEPSSSTRRLPSQFEIVEASLEHQQEQVTHLNSYEFSALDMIDLNEPSSSSNLCWLD